MNCSGTTCEGAQILCPTGDDTSCSIYCTGNSTCSLATISTGNGNNMASFDLHCSSTKETDTGTDAAFLDFGCNWMNLQLISATIENVSISCESYKVCAASTWKVDSNVTNMDLQCVGESACEYTKINVGDMKETTWNTQSRSECELVGDCDTKHISQLNVKCQAHAENDAIDEVHEFVIRNASNGFLSTMDNSPENEIVDTCQSLQIRLGYAIVDDFILTCKGRGCQGILVSQGNIANSAMINCAGECGSFNAELIAVSPHSTFEIQCGNESLSCEYLNLRLLGFVDDARSLNI